MQIFSYNSFIAKVQWHVLLKPHFYSLGDVLMFNIRNCMYLPSVIFIFILISDYRVISIKLL